MKSPSRSGKFYKARRNGIHWAVYNLETGTLVDDKNYRGEPLHEADARRLARLLNQARAEDATSHKNTVNIQIIRVSIFVAFLLGNFAGPTLLFAQQR